MPDDLDDLLLRNRAAAKSLGWTPGDFDCGFFDPTLIRAIRDFQGQRLLPQTGVADARTIRALAGYRDGLIDKAERQQREDNLQGLGSVTRYAPDDPWVVRSAPFTGRILVLRDWSPSGAVVAQVDALAVPLAALPADSVAPRRRLVRATLTPGDLSDGDWLGRALADAVPDGVIVQVVPKAMRAIGADPDVLTRWADAVRVHTDVPLAVSADLIPSALDDPEKRAMAVFGRCFDAAMPPVPGERAGQPIEHAAGSAVANWSIFGQIRPNFMVPLYVVHDRTTANEVHRYRAWLQSRGFRGYAYVGPADHLPAFLDPLPAKIVRVDL